MIICRSIEQFLETTKSARSVKSKIGFVPTLGALHSGHISLIERAKQECDIVVVSIFVNPLQFQKDKYDNYPRNLEHDRLVASASGVDILFTPGNEDIYPTIQNVDDLFIFQTTDFHRSKSHFEETSCLGDTFIRVPSTLTDKLDGHLHPWHFDGVATVVYKLLNIIKPDIAYFGEKDPQQVAIINRLIKDFHMEVKLETVATARDHDGLALSSRNRLLNADDRQVALLVSQTLAEGLGQVRQGQTNTTIIIDAMKNILAQSPGLEIEMIDIVDSRTLDKLLFVNESALIHISCRVGDIRLTDNVTVSREKRDRCIAGEAG